MSRLKSLDINTQAQRKSKHLGDLSALVYHGGIIFSLYKYDTVIPDGLGTQLSDYALLLCASPYVIVKLTTATVLQWETLIWCNKLENDCNYIKIVNYMSANELSVMSDIENDWQQIETSCLSPWCCAQINKLLEEPLSHRCYKEELPTVRTIQQWEKTKHKI